MRKKFNRTFSPFLALIILLAVMPAFYVLPVKAAQSAVKNNFIVDFKTGTTAAVIRKDPEVLSANLVFPGSIEPQFQNIYKIETFYSQSELLNRYGSTINYLEINNPIKAADVLTNDPGFGNDPGNIDHQWGLFKAGFPAAWAKSTGTSTTIVAVIDTGIDGTHEDLSAGQVGAGYNFITNNPIPAGTDSDDNGHGTLIAGVIGATPNNFRGITGANWNVTLMPLKALDNNGSGNSADIAGAIVYAADHGANVINMSLGGMGFGNDTTLSDAVRYAFGKNVVLVAAAGNDVASTGGNLDQNPVFPICDDNGQNMIIGVAATDINDQKAQFSNFGKSCVDVSAPGKHILSTINFDPGTHIPTANAYAYASGTSMATPFVSAEAALIKQLYPAASNFEIRDRIINSADPIDSANPIQCDGNSCAGLIGKGRINAYAALDPSLTIVLQEGTLAEAQNSSQEYFISGGQKHPVSQFVSQQRFGPEQPRMVPAYVLDAIPTGSYTLPNEGTLVKSPQNPTVYEIMNGLKRPITFQVWQQRGFQPAQVNILSDVEMTSWLSGTFLPPIEGTLVRDRRSSTVYWVVDGLLHPVNRGYFIRHGLDTLPVVILNGNDLKGYAVGNAFVY